MRKREREHLKARIRAALELDPDLSNRQLGLRFGKRKGLFKIVRDELGLIAPRSELLSGREMRKSRGRGRGRGPTSLAVGMARRKRRGKA